MAERKLMKGSHALAEAALRAGCRYYFGYPITPQTELSEYMARELPARGGVFIQAESEVAAINMVYGAAGAGGRVMTSSSGPGVSLKQEGISYLCGSELPCVIINIMRGGPGLGNIMPSQSDYFQAVKGGGHGDYRLIVLAPSTVQEAADLMRLAFELSERYRNPAMVLGDGMLGQMMEPVELPPEVAPAPPERPWATRGTGGGEPRVITSIYLEPEVLEEHNRRLQAKYAEIEAREARWELLEPESDFFLVAYGTVARIARSAMKLARGRGLSVGLLRPITLWPFPRRAFEQVLPHARAFLTVEMSSGQMVEDVRLAVDGRAPVAFHGRLGGVVPEPEEIVARLEELAGKVEDGGVHRVATFEHAGR
ncbi:3-methyl-2-oxobutanoate dehydrogenase subunit VorB [Limnochorda pilosa]|uniref:2-ketoisovalerate ferredoxin reductase n=1 Tax=Limnochorda pilosa TaxID=1555112 RepID=A0A0K2SQ51_LIMPI|nr:3-methyl-2-oxobutanoate dehydrogenase subunit VorB [Limnochorda pilosa]BAS29137.1 2-ketoisovalerate ferredoxin reductase [Limnochorda pilosa]